MLILAESEIRQDGSFLLNEIYVSERRKLGLSAKPQRSVASSEFHGANFPHGVRGFYLSQVQEPGFAATPRIASP